MKRVRWIGGLVIAGLVYLLVPAEAAAQTEIVVPVQGYLTGMEGAPVDNPALTLTFRIYEAPTGGEALYTESQAVPVERGHFTAYMGAVVELDATIFRDYGTLFLGMQVSSDEEMIPRFELGSVPYAAYAEYAGDARSFDGITRDRLGTLVDTWARAAAYDTEGELTELLDDNYLPSSYVPEWAELLGVPEGFADGVDDNTTYDAAGPIALDGTTFGLSSEGCEVGGVWEWRGDGWSCEPNRSYTGAAPIEVAGTEIELSAAGCEAGDSLQWDGSEWVCDAPSGEDFALSGQSCPEGQVATGIDDDGELTCSSPGCPDGYVRLGESCIERDFSSRGRPEQAVNACYGEGARLCTAYELAYACAHRVELGLAFPDNTWLLYDEASRIYWGDRYYIGYMVYRRRGGRCYGPDSTNPSGAIYSWSHDSSTQNYVCCRTASP